jgi:hypothetical protein
VRGFQYPAAADVRLRPAAADESRARTSLATSRSLALRAASACAARQNRGATGRLLQPLQVVGAEIRICHNETLSDRARDWTGTWLRTRCGRIVRDLLDVRSCMGRSPASLQRGGSTTSIRSAVACWPDNGHHAPTVPPRRAVRALRSARTTSRPSCRTATFKRHFQTQRIAAFISLAARQRRLSKHWPPFRGSGRPVSFALAVRCRSRTGGPSSIGCCTQPPTTRSGRWIYRNDGGFHLGRSL